MKLRFRENALRLRLNQREVARLAAGASVEEKVLFPNGAHLRYVFETAGCDQPCATLEGSTIRVQVPVSQVRDWAEGAELGLYFCLPTDKPVLQVAIEKDLQCIDGPPEEFDSDAFSRQNTSGQSSNNC